MGNRRKIWNTDQIKERNMRGHIALPAGEKPKLKLPFTSPESLKHMNRMQTYLSSSLLSFCSAVAAVFEWKSGVNCIAFPDELFCCLGQLRVPFF